MKNIRNITTIFAFLLTLHSCSLLNTTAQKVEVQTNEEVATQMWTEYSKPHTIATNVS